MAEAKIEELRLRAKHPPRPFWSLAGLIEAWEDLVGAIGSGYRLTVDDYTNDLSVRNLLGEVLAGLPAGSVRDCVTRRIAAADDHYRAVTHEVQEPIHGHVSVPWWYMRVPNVLVGELAEDLAREGWR